MIIGASVIIASIIIAISIFAASGQISSSLNSLSLGSAVNTGTGSAQAQTPPTTIATAPTTTASSAPSTFNLQMLTNKPYLGNPNASVIMVEFGDLQCPFCAEYFSQSEPQILQNYVNTGKIEYVWMNFPLTQIHPNAENAADAAMCVYHLAGNTAFWKFHDIVYQNTNTVNVAYAINDSNWATWAGQAGVNATAFASCYSSKQYDSEVQSDESNGITYGVGGTPTFYIVNAKTGSYTSVVGAQPYAAFQSALDSAISQAG